MHPHAYYTHTIPQGWLLLDLFGAREEEEEASFQGEEEEEEKFSVVAGKGMDGRKEGG